MSIYITGDTHGYYNEFMERLNSLTLTPKDIVVVLGDFGFVCDNTTQAENFKLLTRKDYTIAFTDGNHEDFDLLKSFSVCKWNGGKAHMIAPNIIHLMRGQIFTVENKTFFAFGGGYSSLRQTLWLPLRLCIYLHVFSNIPIHLLKCQRLCASYLLLFL